MIIPVLILSTVFLSVAFIINENNANYLLSGYNTMSEAERQNFDLKAYLPFFRKFHIFLGLSFLIISLILLYFVNADWCGIFLGTYPILAYIYFIWKSNKYTKNKSKKQNITTYIVMSIMLLLFVAIVFAFNSSLKDNEIILNNNSIEITGQYGIEIDFNDLKSVELINTLPEISSKINGFDLETIKKGYFRIAKDEKVKLLINSNKLPVILLITKDNQKIFYSAKIKSNEEIYRDIRKKLYP